MDGLLLDSEILWHKAEVEIFGSLGVPLEEASRSTKGMFVSEVVTYWFARFPWSGCFISQSLAQNGARGAKKGATQRALVLANEHSRRFTGSIKPDLPRRVCNVVLFHS